GFALAVSPNPFSDQTVFSFTNDGYDFKKGEIEILNELGEVTSTIAVSKYSGNYVYKKGMLAKGIYFYRLKLDEKVVKGGKLVVE
ncbi:MAG: hypothetical protein JWO06_1517, partial [Bacteroidota bacterium]|nr:hypothetical protein [Bacteroidota bacterium]